MDINKKLIKFILLSDSEFVSSIEQNPTLIHEKDHLNKTLIHYACGLNGQQEKIKFLLEHGASLIDKDNYDLTAYEYVNTIGLKSFIDKTLIEIEKKQAGFTFY